MIVPDDKDWTWVLERPCPECGFDARTFPAEQVGAQARANAATWQRTGFRSDGAPFTVETFAQYVIHDPMHHLWDVRG